MPARSSSKVRRAEAVAALGEGEVGLVALIGPTYANLRFLSALTGGRRSNSKLTINP
jgi:hypothetical protein